MLVWTPVGVGLTAVVVLRLVTGGWLGTSVADKSLVANYGLGLPMDRAGKV